MVCSNFQPRSDPMLLLLTKMGWGSATTLLFTPPDNFDYIVDPSTPLPALSMS
jgi:hypothetical protein